jgi:hypothetical protein
MADGVGDHARAFALHPDKVIRPTGHTRKARIGSVKVTPEMGSMGRLPWGRVSPEYTYPPTRSESHVMSRLATRRAGLTTLLSGVLVAAATLTGCGGPPAYSGDDAATLKIRTVQIGCCYVEGSLHFARLDGPMHGEFGLEDSKERDFHGAGPRVVGVVTLSLKPGYYRLSVWERVCDGNCNPENLDAPVSRAAAEFNIVAGQVLPVGVAFPLMEATTIQVGP